MEAFFGMPGLIIGLVMVVGGIIVSKAGAWHIGIIVVVVGIMGIVASVRSLIGGGYGY